MGHIPLHVQQERAHRRVGTHCRSRHAHLLGADERAHVLAAQIDVLLAVNEREVQLDLRQQSIDRLVVLGVLACPQGVQADGAEHGTGVHINIAQLGRQTACQRGFACPRRPVDCNRYHFRFSFYSIIASWPAGREFF